MVKYAGFWIRFVASLLDSIVVGVPLTMIQLALISLGTGEISQLIGLIAAAILIWFEGAKGGTPGKLIVGLRVVNKQGRYIGVKAILRYLGKFVSLLIIGIGYLMIAWDKEKQGLHDKIADTHVVWKP